MVPHKMKLDYIEERFVARAVAGQYFFGYAQELIFPDWEHTSAFLERFLYQKVHPGWAGIPHALCGEWHRLDGSDGITRV